jgi:hypothetical protein
MKVASMTAIATSQGLPPPEAMPLGAGCGVIAFCPSLESPRACKDAPASLEVSSLFESGWGWAWLENRARQITVARGSTESGWRNCLLYSLFRLRPRRHELAVTKDGSTLKGVVLCIGVLLLVKAPHSVASTDQVANGASLSFLICLIVALAIYLWRLAVALWLWRLGRLSLELRCERNPMLPARHDQCLSPTGANRLRACP